ncbi:hypothetical protein COB11_03620 [Candidatus Aerophobetes bacterium]|uniref:PI3K/PI4K catalytic domain-containing protein n=1 Tax=Aerophobetes bacterium TaxID=2030807 RepID=A0A2A4YJH5_UNCAE|nr:MAG: hypothetical protein COB11_03620 [Candidatus Aerophobetes bacterium]
MSLYIQSTGTSKVYSQDLTVDTGRKDEMVPTVRAQRPSLSLKRFSLPLQGSGLQPKKRPNLSQSLVGFSEAVRIQKVEKKEFGAAIKELERTKAHLYIKEYYRQSDLPISQVFRTMYPKKTIELIDIQEGVTDTKIVKVDGIRKHVLKKVSLPEGITKHHWGDVSVRLKMEQGGLQEKVTKLFFECPGSLMPQNFPYVNYAQREKVAFIFGEKLGVLETEVIKAEEGVFSLHKFIENSGSARLFDLASDVNQKKLNLQQLQNIGILDILIENQDRNPGNILVVSRPDQLDLVPIDHALSYQQKNFQLTLAFGEIKKPCWTQWKRADDKLTDETKEFIKKLDKKTLLAKAEEKGIIIDDKIEKSLKFNVDLLQRSIETREDITLNQLYNKFLNPTLEAV